MRKIGIVLSGGGARGFVHIGVLKALLEADIRPEIVAGASAGAIVGSMYAAGKTTDQMWDFVEKNLRFRSVSLAAPWRSFLSLAPFGRKLEGFLGVKNFEGLQMPFSVSVSNLQTGGLEKMDTGNISQAVIASSSVPLVFKPVKINEMLYKFLQ